MLKLIACPQHVAHVQAARALKSSRGICQDADEVAQQLRELAKAAPQFLSVEPAREGSGSMLRLNRRANVKAVRQHLAANSSQHRLLVSPGAVI